MLALLTPTDPSWVDAAQSDLNALLSDHAHCELKAAQSALSLLGRYGGEMPALVEPLSKLAHEETDHFNEVEQMLRARGATLGLPRADDYVVQLRAAAKQDRTGQRDSGASAAQRRSDPILLDRLLVAALIEGRSCERFKLLSERLSDPVLRALYRELMAAEAHHFTLFASLAAECFGVAASKQRLTALAAREAFVAGRMPLGPTVHG
jgi:tRNA-(ms[2]io[6]A)-hydroxylase